MRRDASSARPPSKRVVGFFGTEQQAACVRWTRKRSRAAALGGIVLALACGGPSDARTTYLRAVAVAETPLEEALRRFDEAVARSDPSGARHAAGQAWAAAVAARDSLEALRVPASLEIPRGEELLFLNHVIPAYRAFAAADAGAADLAKLQSILRRGRAHQKRGRDALRQAPSVRP